MNIIKINVKNNKKKASEKDIRVSILSIYMYNTLRSEEYYTYMYLHIHTHMHQ